MSLSRRKFMKAGVVAAACAALPLKSVMAQKGNGSGTLPQEPPPTSLEQLNYYSESSFTPYLNTEFLVHLDESNTRGLKLTAVSDYFSTLSRKLTKSLPRDSECFSLLLTIPSGGAFEQDTYLIDHVALGSFYLFMAPIGDDRNRPLDYYEAVIYRYGDRYTTSSTTFTAEAKVKIEQQSMAKPVAGQNQPARGQSKTSQEIFYFRPPVVDPEIAKAKEADARAAARRAAGKMTMAQTPDIGGLRLGMTLEEALALFPGIKDDREVRPSLSRRPNRFGTSSITIKPAKYSTDKKFEQVSQVVLTLLDGRVSTLNVSYDSPVWEHVDEFVTKFSEEARLPGIDSWEAHAGMETQLKTLKGQDFEISVFAGSKDVGINYVLLRDMTAKQTLSERKAKMMADGKP